MIVKARWDEEEYLARMAKEQEQGKKDQAKQDSSKHEDGRDAASEGNNSKEKDTSVENK